MDNLPLVSIILLNYNGIKYIRNCLQSILKSDYRNFELIIVDNNSTDKSIDIVEKEFYHDNRIKIIKSNKNLGFAVGNNLGAKHAKGKYLSLLNMDTIVDARWLTELIGILEYDNTIGVAQSKLLSLADNSIYDSAGDYIDFFGNNFRRGAWQSGGEKDIGQYDTVHDIFSARGAALFTTKEIVDNIGLFDEDFFMTFEDIDFSWRVRLYGKRVVFVPKSIVYHEGQGITSKEPAVISLLDMLAYKNIRMCMIKNYDFFHMIIYGIVSMIADIATGYFLLDPFITQTDNKSARIRGKLKGYLWILCNVKKLSLKRQYIQHNIRKVPDSEIMKYMIRTSIWDLIVWAFNVKKFGHTRARTLYIENGLT
jgi:GT2 family glycosyltransferase